MHQKIEVDRLQNEFYSRNFLNGRATSMIEIVSSLFILLFLYTALSKTFDIGSTVNALRKTPILSSFPEVAAWSVVGIEYLVALLLFLPRTKKCALHVSFFLMLAFTIYIAYMKIFVPKLPCTCGGVISKMSWNQHLLFNIFFSLLAASAILIMRKINQKKKSNMNQAKIVLA